MSINGENKDIIMTERLCVFGDSIAWGAYDAMGGWVQRLWRDDLFSDDYIGIYNLSIDGDTSRDVLHRCEHEIIARKPGMIIFSIGSNDAGRVDGDLIVPVDAFIDNIRQLHRIAQTNECEVIFVGLFDVDEDHCTPVSWDDQLSYANVDIKEYDHRLRQYTRENDCYFIDMMHVITVDDLEDGIHPNTRGHEKIYEHVKRYLSDNQLITHI
jgi:lysophospholipase L1-like esterase